MEWVAFLLMRWCEAQADLDRLPPYEVGVAYRQLACDHYHAMSAWLQVCPAWMREEVRDQLLDADLHYRFWDQMAHAGPGSKAPWACRWEWANVARGMIGEAAWLEGRWPPPVPLRQIPLHRWPSEVAAPGAARQGED